MGYEFKRRVLDRVAERLAPATAASGPQGAPWLGKALEDPAAKLRAQAAVLDAARAGLVHFPDPPPTRPTLRKRRHDTKRLLKKNDSRTNQ